MRSEVVTIPGLLVSLLSCLLPSVALGVEPLATTTLGFDSRILGDLGLAVRSPVATAAPGPVQHPRAFAFRAIEPSALELDGDLSDFEHFRSGELRHTGGFTLGLSDGEVSLENFVLRVTGFDWDLLDETGGRWLIVVHPQQRVTPEGGLELRRADVVVAPELAARLGRTDLARAYIGEAHIAITSQMLSQATQGGTDGVMQGGTGGCEDIFTGAIDVQILSFNTVSQVAREPGVRVAVTASAELTNVGTAAIRWNWSIAPDSPVGPHPYLSMHFYRIANGRIEQIGRSDLKHAFNATNDGCPCPSGPIFYPGCSDFYGAGTNSNPYHLGPRDELTAFTGAWTRVGSHFDSLPVDDVRDHGGSTDHDDFEHRLVLPESKLQTAGATYYKEAWYVAGADVDLFNSMGFSEVVPTLGGSTWTFPDAAGAAFANGSALDAFVDPVSPPPGWDRVLVDSGEGRLDLAVRTSDLGGGLYHYEYALMNYDFDRRVAAFEVPIPAAATVSNFGFSDADTDGINDWDAVANTYFVRFAAPAGNDLDWGTLFSFGFDVDAAPEAGSASLRVLEPGVPEALTPAVLAPASALQTDELVLDGVASGGSVDLTVEGVPLSIPTSPGQPGSSVVTSIAAAINADPTLAPIGITASASGVTLTVNGPISDLTLADAGLLSSVPAVGPLGLLITGGLLVVFGSRYLRRRSSTGGQDS